MKIHRLQLSGWVGRSMLILLMLFCYQLTKAQSPVSGTVKDETGLPLPGVSIRVKGKSISTTTDLNGVFKINAAGTDVIQFSFIGYQAKEVTVGNNATLNI